MTVTLVLAALLAAPPLEPSGGWVVEANVDGCILRRNYGTGAEAVTLAINPPLQATGKIGLAVQTGWREVAKTAGPARVRIDGQAELKTEYTAQPLADRSAIMVRMGVDDSLLRTMAGATTLTVSAGPVDREFRLVAPQKGLAALQKCREDLLRSWALDPAEMLVGPQPTPREAGATRFTDGNVGPRDAVTGFRAIAVLDISAAGRPTACRVAMTTSVDPQTEKVICALKPNIWFAPAKDAAGVARPGHYLVNVRMGKSR